MAQTVFTVIARVKQGHKAALESSLRQLDYRGIAPAGDPLGLNQIDVLHFASLFLYDDAEDGWSLVFESNIDGTASDYFDALAGLTNPAVRDAWVGIFQNCAQFEGQALDCYPALWASHLQKPSAQYIGTVGRTRRDIVLEAVIRDCAETTLSSSQGLSPTAAASAVRTALRARSDTQNFDADIPAPVDRSILFWAVGALVVALVLGIVAVLVFAGVGHTWAIVLTSALALSAIALAVVVRWLENGAAEDVSRPDAGQVRDITAFEDFLPTNHMVSVVHLHHDWFRRTLRRTISWVLNVAVYLVEYRGKLGPIPTIHFAHWSIVNGGRRLMFVSNFDGSWESYLDDFTLKAANGLTLAWIFGLGFPKTRWLAWGGAARAEAFIDWARRSMTPSLVWYMAYPGLSTTRINQNTELRRLIAADTGATNTGNWLERV